jgi:hypothetical protein
VSEKAGLAAAREWWRVVAAEAARASPPQVGKATLVFTHVPKTVPRASP